MKKLLLKTTLIILAFITATVLLIVFMQILLICAHGTNIRFQSSVCDWSDREVLFKGRKFEQIVTLFELYKITSDRPDAILQRTTRKPGWSSIRHWYNNYSAPKWRVPYAIPCNKLMEKYYRSSSGNGRARGSSKQELESARMRAKEYIAGL